MNFDLTDTQKEILGLARQFASKEIAPIIDKDEENSHFRKELFLKFGEAGLIGITTGVKYGGSALGTLEYALALEEIAYQSAGYAVSFSVTALPKNIIEEFGTEKQKQKYIPKLLSGENLGAFALTEAGSGSDAASLKTTARLENDHYIINGVKQFITNGEKADIFIVMARTNGDGAKGISTFIVEKSFAGVRGGKLEQKMGMCVSPTQEMIFENVKVPKENLISNIGDGFKIALRALDSGRISIGAISIGLARAALDKAIAYAKEREQFGSPIISFQGISFLLAELATELEAARLLVRQAAYLKDQGKPFTKEASMAKLKATQACMQITTEAVQVFGGYGYMKEFTVERYMREAKVLQLVEGTTQIQKLVIARNL